MKLESRFCNFGQIPCMWAESMWVDTLYVHTLGGSKLKSTLCQILVMHMRIELFLNQLSVHCHFFYSELGISKWICKNISHCQHVWFVTMSWFRRGFQCVTILIFMALVTIEASVTYNFVSISYRAPVLEKASKSVWELILDSTGLGKEISEMVEKVFSRLSGREPPLFPLPDGETHTNKEIENEKEKRKGKGWANENKEKENSPSSLKKRSFSELNAGGACEAASIFGDPPAILEDSSKSPNQV